MLPLLALLSLTGCSDTQPESPPVDAGPPIDIAPYPHDFAFFTTGARTGDPCKQNKDCAPSQFDGDNKGTCTHFLYFFVNGGYQSIGMPDGYCVGPCNPDNNNLDGTNLDCPADYAICVNGGASGGAGTCWAGCRRSDDCRPDYLCAFAFPGGIPACVPPGSSGCDPPSDPRPQSAMCGVGQRCADYSIDHTYGQCAEECDPVAPHCTPANGQTPNCVVDLATSDGLGECLPGTARNEGDPCDFLGSCRPGLICYQSQCRRYCRNAGADAGAPVPCPQGQICDNIQIDGHIIPFTAEQTGVCHP
jgi:hypothetical protein